MDKKPQTVIIKLKGGMGNQMFQYAFGKSLETKAAESNTPITLLFDDTAYTNPNTKDTRRPYMLSHLQVKDVNFATPEAVEKARNPFGLLSKITRQVKHKLNIDNEVAFNPRLLTAPYKKYYEGYWQTEKYFTEIIPRLRQEFQPSAPLGATAKAIYDQMMSDENAVSIFYRRTDYVGNKTFDIGEQEYQQAAIAKMKELVPNMRLYVMSDDIEWVKENADLPEGSVFVSSKENIPAHEEIPLAAACRHNIIPNSTFAWWGAWLNPNRSKIVIAPKEWSKVTGDQFSDIVPAAWLRV